MNTTEIEINGTLDAIFPIEVSLITAEDEEFTISPTVSLVPTYEPTGPLSSFLPSTSLMPSSTEEPSTLPSSLPTNLPSASSQPSLSGWPSIGPSRSPSSQPSSLPSMNPTSSDKPFGITLIITDDDVFSSPLPSIEYEIEL